MNNVTALAGGVGAARFLKGLVQVMPPENLTVIGNTGDDDVIYGLHISPDLDIVTYSLAGLEGPQGWGFDKETWRALEQARSIGADMWFQTGDRDLGTHLARTAMLAQGVPLSQVTEGIRRSLGVQSSIIPMSDDPVRTKLTTSEGVELDFQEYFVRGGFQAETRRVRFDNVEQARPAPGVIESLQAADRIIICPSNPVVSIGPILAVPGIREALVARRDSVVAITPIVDGKALKGPAAQLLPLVASDATASSVGVLYLDICSRYIIDHRDSDEAKLLEDRGLKVVVTETIMSDANASARLAEVALET